MITLLKDKVMAFMIALLLFKEIMVLVLMIICGYSLVKFKLVHSDDSHIFTSL